MKRSAAIGLVLLLVLVAVGGGLAAMWAWRAHRGTENSAELTLYGNVDLRQVELAFNANDRIAAVLAEEGDRVRPGQVLARLDTSRLEPMVAQAEAQAAAQRAVAERLRHGSRPEEVAQARANVDSAKADAKNARVNFDRLNSLNAKTGGLGVSQQDLDAARAALDAADARLVVSQKALDLAVAGPRTEDVQQAEAQLRAAEAALALARRQLADAQLVAPLDAVVRSRLMEPGEMASPQRPVFTLAITDPKWVRAYVAEPDLGNVRPGMTADVTVDAFPGRRFRGRVGFISPVAEFTPKAVQTEELRTKLVYEVRVFVYDPSDELRLGTPATVRLRKGAPATEAAAAGNAGQENSYCHG